jgi:coenzyme F420 hydrogenase subunit beta
MGRPSTPIVLIIRTPLPVAINNKHAKRFCCVLLTSTLRRKNMPVNLSNWKNSSQLEKSVFGRQRNPEEEFGIYRTVLVARSTDQDVLRVCQDGGVVTTLLTFALENNIIQGAAVSTVNPQKPLYPVPTLATSRQQILGSAGTRYFNSPNIKALQEGIKSNLERLAFVGTPCQIEAIRRIQMRPSSDYAKKLKLVVGLICGGTFLYEGLIEDYIEGKLHVNPKNIRKANIKGKLILTMKTGETEEILLKNIRHYSAPTCTHCRDYSAELSDISVGSLGLNDWSLVIIRSETGQKLFMEAEEAGVLKKKPIEQEKKSLDLLIDLSRKKRSKGGL